jgi:hypothetical protein
LKRRQSSQPRTVSAERKKLIEDLVRRWFGILRLGDWNVRIDFQELAPPRLAEVTCDDGSMTAHMVITTPLALSNELTTLKDTIRHEMLHVATADLARLGKTRCVTEEQLNEAEERLVLRLERVLGAMEE